VEIEETSESQPKKERTMNRLVTACLRGLMRLLLATVAHAGPQKPKPAPLPYTSPGPS
jgi:hypothetical protein